VVEAFPGRFRIVCLAAGNNVERLAEQIQRHRPRLVAVASERAREALARHVDVSGLRVVVGPDGMVEAATHPEAQLVVSAAVGALGLVPDLSRLEAGKDVALANKETLVIAGELMVREARRRGARMLPIDSEHCALHQCLDGKRPEQVRRLVLTASGGPFRRRPRGTFGSITASEALDHPTWRMGRKITIDSATLMNKGLEVIEARWLFDTPPERVDRADPPAIRRPLDGGVRGRLAARSAQRQRHADPDPVRAQLSERWETPLAASTSAAAGRWSSSRPTASVSHASISPTRRSGAGARCPAVLNAANEEAVQAFLEERIPFNGDRRTASEKRSPFSTARVRRLARRRAGRGCLVSPRGGHGPGADRGARGPLRIMDFLTNTVAFILVLGVDDLLPRVRALHHGQGVLRCACSCSRSAFGKRLLGFQVGRHRLPAVADPARRLREARGRAGRPAEARTPAGSETGATSRVARAGSASSSTWPARR